MKGANRNIFKWCYIALNKKLIISNIDDGHLVYMMDVRGLSHERASMLSNFYSCSVTTEDTHIHVSSSIIRKAEFVMVWQLDSKVYGCCLISEHETKPELWSLQHIGVHKEKRNKGIGTEMLEFAKFDLLNPMQAAQSSVDKIGLIVEVSERQTNIESLSKFFQKREFKKNTEKEEYVYQK